MFADRRRNLNAWRKYAMYLGFNMRTPGIDSPDLEQGSFREDPGRSSMTDGGIRRRIAVPDVLLFVVVILLIATSIRCVFGDCTSFDLVIQTILKPEIWWSL
jgi:hypothetical protein